MTKLSRKDKYRDLRTSIEHEASQTGRTERSVRLAAPDLRADLRKESRTDQIPVLEDLLGEVKQYNLDNGDLNLEDTQMQILHNLNSEKTAKARRKEHLVAMEQNEDAGGTTRNLYGSDLSSVISAQTRPVSSRPVPSQNKNASIANTAENPRAIQADEIVEEDYLDLFTPNAKQEVVQAIRKDDSFETSLSGNKANRKKEKKKTANAPRQVTNRSKEFEDLFESTTLPAAPKAQPNARPRPKNTSRPAGQEAEDDYFATNRSRSKRNKEDEEDKPAGKGAMIFMIVCCVILVILIVLTIFWMSKLGIF
ncbi:hypothetical protein AAK899_00340 [Erysipelotrichaceae bacterium 51-3]